MTSQGIETHHATALNEMSKKIEDLRISQIQQSKALRKELGGRIDELKAMIEKFFVFNPSPENQAEGTSSSHQQTDPPDLFPGEQSATKTTQINPDHPMIEESLVESDELVLESKQDIWDRAEKCLSHGPILLLNSKPQEISVLFVQPEKATIDSEVLTCDIDEAPDAVTVVRCSKHTRTKIHVHKEFALNATQRKQLMYEVFHLRRPPELLCNKMVDASINHSSLRTRMF
ncbi:Uncharacterized protein Rs2_18376 [Raphanus sativus]|nr:Uncharacterized protein Rs2_18376 [Raphanus sativus]